MLHRFLLLLALLLAGSAHALTADEAKAMAVGESDDRIAAMNKAVANADDRTAAGIPLVAVEGMVDDLERLAWS